MNPANRKFLDDNRHHWITLTVAKYMKHLNANERDGMQRVMREEFQPGYVADLWCPDCVADMVRLLYRRYDEWLAVNPDTKPEPPKNDPALEPLTVAASFPANDPPADKQKKKRKK